jgi:predicted dehydrogenase/threonine dehydrogenase-like Zn-dependent dehydrogenase
MKQLTQRLKNGELRTVDVPRPEIDDWKVLVRTDASLISAGTERAKVEVARESLLGKARRRPQDVRQVLDKARAEGISATVEAVRNRLEALAPLGYCAAGRVERVGPLVRDIQLGDAVACGGENAAHAELLAVPANLCVRVPAGVDPTAAAFTTIGAIALHGFRQANLQLGERVAIVGMGLVGQLTARIARAAGCEVLGIDLEDWRLEVAERAGVLDVARRRAHVSRDDEGAWDAVLVTAAAPNQSDPVSLATDLARERGTIVVVGDVGLELDRSRLYAKELNLRLARSYGPGRYDQEYEERGLDYPLAYVRWTERRNMAEFVRLLAERRIEVGDLITHRFAIDDAASAFDVLTDRHQHALGIVIDYPPDSQVPAVAIPQATLPACHRVPAGPSIGFIGAGSFARRLLIPLAKKHGLTLERVATSSGLSAADAAERFDFARGACTVRDILEDDLIAGVVIATRHDQHGRLALEALQAGKAVFVEKPLCLTADELQALSLELSNAGVPPLMVGFNRRFAPLTQRLRAHLAADHGPANVVIRVNAGPLSDDHWLNDPREGGGRLLAEGCHFLDLLYDLVGAEPLAVVAQGRSRPDQPIQSIQDFSVSVRFVDGSLGTLLYGTAGTAAAGKETVEAHRGRRSGRIDDFRSLRLWGGGRPRTARSWARDKGHSEELRIFSQVVQGELAAPPARSYLTSTAITLAALRSLEVAAETLVEDLLPTTSEP